MPRYSLFKKLQQASAINKIVTQTGIPLAEVIEIFQQKISRRHFLQKYSGLTASFARSYFQQKQQSTVTQQTNISPVLIVGAGIAGLTAAYRLKQAGVPVKVIEARENVGGRIKTLSRVGGTNLKAELGGEFIDSNHKCLRHLATELGFKLIDLAETNKGLVEDIYFFQGHQISIQEIIRDFAPVAKQIQADLNRIKLCKLYAIKLDSLSITDYLKDTQATDTIQKLIEVAYTIEYGLDAQELSSLNLLYLIGTKTNEFKLFGDSDERFYLEGGNDQIPHKLGALLADYIETQTVLESISSRENGCYQVSFRSGNSAFEKSYERVILAIPFSMLRQIPLNIDLPPVKRLAIDILGYGTHSKLITAYEEKIWRTHYSSSGTVYSNLDFQNIWETSQSCLTSKEGLITNLTGGHQGLFIGTKSSEFQAQKLISQLELIFPDISKVQLRQTQPIRISWLDEEYSYGSNSCYRVGQCAKIYGAQGKRVNNLFFAGEHCSQEFQGYMEGGCETGESAAFQILRDLGYV